MYRTIKFLLSPKFTPLSLALVALTGVLSVTGPIWAWVVAGIAFLASVCVTADWTEGN